mmetsp:Transcript_3367/g.7341  ORF Transcript_3367/g.7341 Transcript_3367/m.7341 type:complete len:287 (+) Transcript_3367:473-1333(+)
MPCTCTDGGSVGGRLTRVCFPRYLPCNHFRVFCCGVPFLLFLAEYVLLLLPNSLSPVVVVLAPTTTRIPLLPLPRRALPSMDAFRRLLCRHGCLAPGMVAGTRRFIRARLCCVAALLLSATTTTTTTNNNSSTGNLRDGTITVGPPEHKLGLRASSTCPVHFDNVRVPSTSVLGTVGMGYRYCIEILNEGRIGIAAQQLGIAKACLYDVALPYTMERHQFGTPVANFQGMEHQYAQIATEIHAAELMVYNACRLKEQHSNNNNNNSTHNNNNNNNTSNNNIQQSGT